MAQNIFSNHDARNIGGTGFLLGLLFTCLTLAGCATIARGKYQYVTVNSTPAGEVKVDGIPRGITPLSIKLARKHQHQVVISKEGFSPEVIDVKRHGKKGFLILNVFNGLIPGNIIDSITGARNTLLPANIVVQLKTMNPNDSSRVDSANTDGNNYEQPPLSGPTQGNKTINMAVADLEPEGVGASDAAIIGNLIRSSLVRNSRFIVVERKNMQKVLSEHSFQQTGCTTSECAIKLGRLLNVERMVVGSFGKFLNTYVTSVNVVNVETGRIIYADEAKGTTADDVMAAVKVMSERLATKIY